MSTKVSVASPKWSGKFNLFLCIKNREKVNEVNLKAVNHHGTFWCRKRGPKRGPSGASLVFISGDPRECLRWLNIKRSLVGVDCSGSCTLPVLSSVVTHKVVTYSSQACSGSLAGSRASGTGPRGLRFTLSPVQYVVTKFKIVISTGSRKCLSSKSSVVTNEVVTHTLQARDSWSWSWLPAWTPWLRTPSLRSAQSLFVTYYHSISNGISEAYDEEKHLSPTKRPPAQSSVVTHEVVTYKLRGCLRWVLSHAWKRKCRTAKSLTYTCRVVTQAVSNDIQGSPGMAWLQWHPSCVLLNSRLISLNLIITHTVVTQNVVLLNSRSISLNLIITHTVVTQNVVLLDSRSISLNPIPIITYTVVTKNVVLLDSRSISFNPIPIITYTVVTKNVVTYNLQCHWVRKQNKMSKLLPHLCSNKSDESIKSKLNQSTNLAWFFLGTKCFITWWRGEWKNQRHKGSIQEMKLRDAGDVELNPGPRNAGSLAGSITSEMENKLTLVTQNCRGLAEHNKLKHLLNNGYKLGRRTNNFIIALQETMVVNDSTIKYGWRGNHVFTAGAGHGRGCITLLPSHIQPEPDSIVHLGERGHIFRAIIEDNYAVVANIYAPTGQGRQKVEFFRQVKDCFEAAREPGDDSYLLGDFNTVFEQYELRSRTYSRQEQRLSAQIKQIVDSLALQDSWQNNYTAHTWMQAGMKKSSRLDRIYYDNGLIMSNCEVDWSFTNSDHGAVVATFKERRQTPKQRFLRLNQDLLQTQSTKEAFLKDYQRQVRDIPEGWNPHQKLEFHKCAIRSAYSQVNAERNKSRKMDYDFVKADLHSHITLLEKGGISLIRKNRLMDKINQLKAKMSQLNLEKGRKLAEKMKTKWYNEGERSNKYFLGLLKRKEKNGELNELEIGGGVVTDPTVIEEQVKQFYEQLYNQNQPGYTANEENELLRSIQPINDEEKAKIRTPLNLTQLEKTLKETQDSCPGPDGIPYSYLKATWTSFGPVLLKAWNYSLQINQLPESHRTSWLRLIPKAGKNIKDLKNWRPITLSNCDHKLLTKAISKTLTENLDRVIAGNQTAYLKGRSISDNLRLVALANRLTKTDKNLNGLVVALDARKAFDSVNHGYIKSVLTKFGLGFFVPIFELLYANSKVDIMLNGKLCEGYKIGNGVKQGDALSCTLFILAMEPLIRNIEANIDVGQLESRLHGISLPKCISYADDINIITNNSIRCVRAAISEYEKFSRVSGLQLNADKTEIFNLAQSYTPQQYTFNYMGQRNVVTNLEKIKINGILITTDPDETERLNLEEVKKNLDKQFTAWSNRSLSLLGKIQIYKTFGLSQIIYSTRVFRYNKKGHSEIRNRVYKFLWNKNYHGNKAPDRIKRDYLNLPIKEGGFGMVEHETVVKAMNARQVTVNLHGKHPIKEIMLNLIINGDSNFNIRARANLDGPLDNYCEVINLANRTLLERDLDYLQQDGIAKNMLLSERLTDVIRPDRKGCLELNLLRHRGITTVRQLLADQASANHFRMRLLHYSYATLMDACLTSTTPVQTNDRYLPVGHKYRLTELVSSRQLRMEIAKSCPIERFKLQILKDDIKETLTKVKKLKCIRTKSTYLRVLHGDIYTGTRLLKFGLSETDECGKCRQTENLEHLLARCWYPGAIWSRLKALYRKVDQRHQTYDNSSIRFVIGINLSTPKIKLHLEIIKKLVAKEKPNVLPRTLIKQSLDYLVICDHEHRAYYKKLRSTLMRDT